MLKQAIEAEVQEFLQEHDDRRDAGGNRLVVRNGYQPARKIVTGAGAWRSSSRESVTIRRQRESEFTSRHRSCRPISDGASPSRS